MVLHCYFNFYLKIAFKYLYIWVSLVVQLVKNTPVR